MYKLLALDLDGTVLNSHHAISPILKAKIQAIKDDVEVIIVTGRHHTAAHPYYDELGLTTPIICCNGTYRYDYASNKVLSANAIHKQHARQFISLAEQHNMKVVLYVTDTMLYSDTNPVDYMLEMAAWADNYATNKRPNIKPIASFPTEIEAAEYVWKFVIEGDNTAEFENLPFVKSHFNGERSWHNRVDFANKGNTKGKAVSQYAETLGFGAEHVVAIGDNHNDISMLEYAGMGVAMAQADDRVKQSANKVTLTNNDDEHSLARIIEELF